MTLSVLGCVCVSVCALCVTIRLNPQLSLTGLAEWTAEVYHCLLISSDSHQPIRAGHSVSGPRGTSRSGSTYLRGLQSRRPSFRVRESQISQSYQRQQMLSSLLPGEKYSLSTSGVKDSRINLINERVRWQSGVTASPPGGCRTLPCLM